jgi:lactate dehydrogenase-like 2-hydroxyacid dehydrogenase
MLACPANEGSRYFLDAARVARLKPGAIVVNVSRGDVIVDDALIAALQSGRVRAAGLDVFEGEPNLDERYRQIDSVFMLPHIGSSTIETRMRMAESLRDGLLAEARDARADNRID